jgi:hypothetical protein
VRYGLTLLMLIAVPCCSQTAQTGKATTSGSCSPAVTGSRNSFTITCGIDSKQGQKMLDIMNKILANQLDPDLVMAKLDEIGKGVDELRRSSRARHLSDRQKVALIAAMSPFRGATVSIEAPMNDPEAYSFAEDFVAVFRSAGLRLAAVFMGADKTGVNEVMRSGPPVPGIDIEPTDEKEWNTALVQTFAGTLEQNGIPHSAHSSANPTMPGNKESPQMHLWVGTKPQE